MTSRHDFLNSKLTIERVRELSTELGFLGICDLLFYTASLTDGSIELVSERVVVRIKKRKKSKVVKAPKLGAPVKAASKAKALTP